MVLTSQFSNFIDDHALFHSGSFGIVYRCMERSTGRFFVAKFVDTRSAAEKQAVRNEISVMNQLYHPKLIRLHDAFEDRNEMCLIMEL